MGLKTTLTLCQEVVVGSIDFLGRRSLSNLAPVADAINLARVICFTQLIIGHYSAEDDPDNDNQVNFVCDLIKGMAVKGERFQFSASRIALNVSRLDILKVGEK